MLGLGVVWNQLYQHCWLQISVGSVVKQCWASPVLGWVTIQRKAGALGVMVVVALGFQVCHYHHAGSLGVHSAPPHKLRRCSSTAPKKLAVWESRPGCQDSLSISTSASWLILVLAQNWLEKKLELHEAHVPRANIVK